MVTQYKSLNIKESEKRVVLCSFNDIIQKLGHLSDLQLFHTYCDELNKYYMNMSCMILSVLEMK